MVARILHFIQKVLLKRVWFVILIFILFIFVRGTWNMYQKAQFAKNNRDYAVAKLAEATKREDALRTELKKMDSPRGVEAEIRQSFDVGRKGERMIVLVDAPPKVKKTVLPKLTIWEKVVHFLGIR